MSWLSSLKIRLKIRLVMHGEASWGHLPSPRTVSFTGVSKQHQFQQGGLAAAVGADNFHKVLLPDGKVPIIENGFSIVGKIKISYFDDRYKTSIRLFQCSFKLICNLSQIGHPVFSQRIGIRHLAADLSCDEFSAFG